MSKDYYDNHCTKVSVYEIKEWVTDFMSKHSFCGEWTPVMQADEEMAKRLADMIYNRLYNN